MDMAIFKGTRQEFDRFIGPRVRNVIQQISRSYKKEIGCCEHCDAQNVQLDAAHRHGFERPVLIEKALQEFTSDKIITANLSQVDKKIKELHDPIADVILVLCKKCHLEYDKAESILRSANALPIKLIPSNEEEFKKSLLRKRCAKITVHMVNGKSVMKIWNAKSFTNKSDVMTNLRSRAEFRNGNWQDQGIKEVCVTV